MMLLVALGLAAATATVEVPLSGPPTAEVATHLRSVPGVEDVRPSGRALSVQVRPGEEVRLRTIARLLEERAGLSVDHAAFAVGPHTVFELNAGRCFYCAEKPLGTTLARLPAVERWTVVDYAPKGRLRFRVETKAPLSLERLGAGELEDVLLTARYDGVEREPNLYWPTGGIAWRAGERAAREEATRSRRPLMIFPTAGT